MEYQRASGAPSPAVGEGVFRSSPGDDTSLNGSCMIKCVFPPGSEQQRRVQDKSNAQKVLTGQTVMSGGKGRLISSSSTCVGSVTPRPIVLLIQTKKSVADSSRLFFCFKICQIKNTSLEQFITRNCHGCIFTPDFHKKTPK